MRDPNRCVHLTVDLVLEIHAEGITRFGGSQGIRDRALLESAVATPQASFGGVSPYQDVIEIAAAYLCCVCGNHPFIDGNKRAALGACLVFLQLNGLKPKSDRKEWGDLTMEVAAGGVSRSEVAAVLRKLVQ